MKTTPFLCIILGACLLFGSCKKNSSTQKSRIKSASYWLCRAAREGSLDDVLKSIEKGAIINFKDRDGFTPLHYSAKRGNEGITKLLISKGADVNAKDKSSSTSLILAIRRRRGTFRTFVAKDTADYCNRGQNFFRQNEFDRAIEDYTSAIQLNPDNGGAYFLRGCAWAEKGNAEQAIID
jgi:tetratricopeptide (TPR) repeat protein